MGKGFLNEDINGGIDSLFSKYYETLQTGSSKPIRFLRRYQMGLHNREKKKSFSTLDQPKILSIFSAIVAASNGLTT